jgi:hypothetical protein
MAKLTFTDIEEEINRKVFSPETFHIELIKMIEQGCTGYIESISMFCDKYSLDINDILHLIDDNLKGKIQCEAEENRMFKHNVNKQRLPV